MSVALVVPTKLASIPSRGVNGWIVIQSRVDTSYPIGLYLKDYTTGFGDSSSGGNYWLGLDNMYLLTSQSGVTYRLRFELQAASNGK